MNLYLFDEHEIILFTLPDKIIDDFWMTDEDGLETTPYVDVIWQRSQRNFYTTTFEKKRLDFVYCSPAMYDCVTHAEIVEDDYTEPQRHPEVRNFHNPSDHLPVIVQFNIK